jgi:hypothetical protein
MMKGSVSLANYLDRHPVNLLPDPCHVAHGHYFSPHVQFNVPGPPHIIMLCKQAVGMKLLQATEQSADLAPVHFNC